MILAILFFVAVSSPDWTYTVAGPFQSLQECNADRVYYDGEGQTTSECFTQERGK